MQVNFRILSVTVAIIWQLPWVTASIWLLWGLWGSNRIYIPIFLRNLSHLGQIYVTMASRCHGDHGNKVPQWPWHQDVTMASGKPFSLTSRARHDLNTKSSVGSQKGTITIKRFPLRTRRALLPWTLYSDRALLLLNRTSLNIDSALLALNWCLWKMHVIRKSNC